MNILLLVTVVLSSYLVTGNYSDTSNRGTKCMQEYLRRKGKLEIETPTHQWDLSCRFITTSVLSILSSTIDSKITSSFPDNAKCLFNEYRNREISDVIVKLDVIRKSELSEYEKQFQSNDTRNELRNELMNVALSCETDPSEFLVAFNVYLGIKSPRNTTQSSLEHNYCFAKYVADNKLLPLDNVELNPFGLTTVGLDCDAIISEQQQREEDDIRKILKPVSPSLVECNIKQYREEKIFQASIKAKVLRFLDFPADVQEAEIKKLKLEFGRIQLSAFLCAVADSEADTENL